MSYWGTREAEVIDWIVDRTLEQVREDINRYNEIYKERKLNIRYELLDD